MPQPDDSVTPPPIPPGRYRLRPDGRWWNADELVVIWYGEQWCVVPAVAIAAMPDGDGDGVKEEEG